MDDFGVKYVGKEHAEHLMAILKDNYVISTDWKGEQYLGMNLNWDYDKREVHISMLGYIAEVLIRFHHTAPKMPQD